MRKDILDLISNSEKIVFEFYTGSNNPIEHLKLATKIVPNDSGIYLVFCENRFLNSMVHLEYEIEGNLYSLMYFGKAGGITKTGKNISQGLNGRINNVISDSKRNLKDIKRANYWETVTTEMGIEKLLIICLTHESPQEIENVLYSFLDKNELQYPVLNKRRGRKKI